MKTVKKILQIFVLAVICVLFAAASCFYLLMGSIAAVPAVIVYIATGVLLININKRRK